MTGVRKITKQTDNRFANMYELDLVISIHLNSSARKEANGTEVLYYPGNEEGKKYAQELSRAISSALGTKDRGAKPTNDIYIINHTSATCVLLECLFVSNKEDSEKYNAKAIAKAVADCFKPSLPNELESVNDIVWELINGPYKVEINEREKAVKALDKAKNNPEFASLYWIIYKLVNENA